jgi:glycosyltransferase involved in cell wall biosynthesis
LSEIKSSHQITALISFWFGECAFIGKRFAEKNKLKHFCWILGQDAKAGNKYVKKIKPVADELIALSDFLQEEFEKNHSIRPAHVIPPGIDPAEFPEKDLKKDIHVLGVGSLIPLKQYELFIEIVYELKKDIPDIRAVLCGDGPDEKKLKELVENFGLNDNLLLTGEIPHHEVLLMMKKSKVLLHPSSYEGFGVVCLEALYSGAHVIRFTKAMNKKIDQWHIVKTKEEMRQKTLEILKDQNTSFEKILVYDMNEIVNRMMQLISS